MFPSIYTENGAFVLKGLCLCPEELKSGLRDISALIPVYMLVLHQWGNTGGCCTGRISLQGSLERGSFWSFAPLHGM